MRTAILTGLALLAWVAAAAAAPAPTRATEAPYPPSDVVAGIAWDPATYVAGGAGGDIWPVTWGADGRLYTAWGDGVMPGCRAKVSYGVAALPGAPGADLGVTGCGPFGMKKGKLGSLLAVDGALYAVVNLQNRAWPKPDFAIWWSYDNGAGWQGPGWTFSGRKGRLRPDSFVNFGQGYAGARDGYVYLTAQRAVADASQREAYLMRVPRGSLGREEAYEYYAGTGAGGVPAWDGDPDAASPSSRTAPG